VNYDIVITGAGLAGLSLARHLLLYTSKTVLLLDKRSELPGSTQKVGESLVQLSGFYLGKVLDLEEHLQLNHYLKYNLRFQWKTCGANTNLEDYSCSFIRLGSNIPTYQLDRNLLESHLLDLNKRNPRFRLASGVRDLAVEFSKDGDHLVRYLGQEVRCRWFVDSSGRGGFLKRKLGLERKNTIRHGSTWCWVDGLVNIEKLTDKPKAIVINNVDRRKQGHFPFFLATNHFCDEGMWFWVIPLHGKTSLGLVYEHRVLSPNEVSNARKMLEYVCRKWPLFQRDLPNRKVLDEGRFFDYSYDVEQSISPDRWALTGEAARFSDPLYSPGSDLIAIHNTLILNAIEAGDRRALESKCSLFEEIMRVMYESFVPSYAVSYDCLGDQEAYTLKYTWELAIYFGFFVVPFINSLFADERFMLFHLRKYSILGPINRNLQQFLSAFFHWKKKQGMRTTRHMIDFYEMLPLCRSEKLFYEIGLVREEAETVIEKQTEQLKEFARYIIAHVHAVVLNDRNVLLNAPFVSGLKLRNTAFDPEKMRAAYAPYADSPKRYEWKHLDPFALDPYLSCREAAVEVGV
jgi:flavin-dependent dehydrogenase